MANGDYLLSDRNKIAIRYFGATSNVEWSTLYETLGNPLYQPERFDVASIGDTFILSPRMVNQFWSVIIGPTRTNTTAMRSPSRTWA